MSNLLKLFNLLVLMLIVFGAISWGMWGFFNVEIISVFLGQKQLELSTAPLEFAVFMAFTFLWTTQKKNGASKGLISN